MPRYKITDDQGQVHRVEAASPEAAKQLFLNGGSPLAKPKGDPLLGPAFVFPNPPAGETAISAPKGQGIPSDQNILQAIAGEPGQSPMTRIMTAVGNLMPTPSTAAGVAAGAIPVGGGKIAGALRRPALGAGIGGLLGAGKALLMGEEVAPEAAVGAIGGGVGGAAAAATKAPLMPNDSTRKATQGAQSLLKGEEWSPNVRGLINKKDPASLYSRETVRKMQRGASKNIQNTLDALDQQFPQGVTVMREALDPKTGQPLGLPGKYPKQVKIGEAQKEIADLRKLGRDAEAQQQERELVQALGPMAGQYQRVMGQYARDARLIDYVTGVQKRVKLPGGVNPQDFPGAARAEKSLGGGGGDSASYHGGMFLAHPTSPYGIAHGVGALGALMGKGPVDPSRIAPMGPLRAGAGQILPPVAGGLAGQQVQGIFGLGSTE